ncbi:MAG: CheR family methyltransferase [Thermoanaerobaculia bacterium]
MVGVGASAGGLEACQRLLKGAPTDAGLAFVIVLHLSPEEESHVAEILQRTTAMTVTQVAGDERVERDHVYVIAPGTSLGIRDGALAAGAPVEPHFRARPVNSFFSALAADRGAGCAGVVLSGTGDDGSAGLEAVSAAGGLCLVQDAGTAGYDGMPRSAVDTGVADAVVPPEEMGAILGRFAADPASRPARRREEDGEGTAAGAGPLAPAGPESAAAGRAASSRDGLAEVLEVLGTQYRVDFRDYKRGTLRRRAERRISFHGLSDWREYLDFLAAHPEEVEALYRDLLIGVTSFFRDTGEWELFAREVAPALVSERGEASAVRAWSAGCATGEEAYGLAMVLLEHLDHPDAAGRRVEVKVFASDASPGALEIARRGRYPAFIADQVSAERLERFFRPCAEGFEVTNELRGAVTFAAHDLLSDPPFPNLDLIACRNVLIYLEPLAQERLLERFHFALRPGGTLWLGTAETIGRRTDLFTPAPGNHRIYRATRTGPALGYSLASGRGRGGETKPVPPAAPRPPEGATPVSKAPRLIEKLVLRRYTTPCVVVGHGLEILYFFGPTERYLQRPSGEVRMDLLSWVRPELYAKLRLGLAEAREGRRPVTLTGMRLESSTDATRVEITIEPISAGVRSNGLLLVAFRDVPQPTAVFRAGGEAQGDAKGRERAVSVQRQEELQETREQLRTAVDQLRTASEEHSASYEELLSLNEELQATNEELEASKEELQSLNEELTTTNRQLEERNQELRTLTSDLDNLLSSARVPTVFLDRELRVRRFTPATTEVLRIGPGDVGRPIEDLGLKVRDERLLADAQRVLEDSTTVEVEVGGEDERWFFRRILPYRTAAGTVDGVCLTFHEVTALKQAAEESEFARLYAEAIIRTSRTPLLVLDMEYRIVSANQAFSETFEVGEEEVVGRRLHEVGDGQWDIPRVQALLEEAPLHGARGIRDYDVEHLFKRIGWRSMRLNADVMSRAGRADLILVSIEDVTDLRKAQMAAQSRADELAEEHRRKDEFLAMLGHELRNPLAAIATGIELLERPGAETVEATRTMMARQTGRISSMLDQLLNVARVISGKLELAREPTDVAGAAEAAVESVKPQIDAAGQELIVSLPPPDEALVQGDAMRLAQVAENLLTNAVKYTDAGGRIWLTVETADDTIELSVRDTGIGVEPGLLAHIFDLFTQAPSSTDRTNGGLGLGLPLVRNIVQMHGGSVEAFSGGVGKGTEVVVTLPRLLEGRGVAGPAVKAEAASAPRETHKILVVDDEADAAGALVELLTRKGHTARSVADGESALALVETFEPEVVLLDLGLPGMDGYEVARELRARLGGSAMLVALTGYREDPARLKEAGIDAHLLKPIGLEKLFALMAALEQRGEDPPRPPADPADPAGPAESTER